jgi:hypothetical protein
MGYKCIEYSNYLDRTWLAYATKIGHGDWATVRKMIKNIKNDKKYKIRS